MEGTGGKTIMTLFVLEDLAYEERKHVGGEL